MDRNYLLNLVRFDPDELRAAIEKCQAEARALEVKKDELLQLASVYDWLLRLRNGDANRAEPASAPQVGDMKLRGLKISDAVVAVLKANGGKLHAKKILEQLNSGGLPITGKSPMGTLLTAIRRDPRIEKDDSARNTWRTSN